MLKTAADYRDSLRRRCTPRVFVDGAQDREASPTSPCSRRVSNAVGITYDFAPYAGAHRALMTGAARRAAARPSTACCTINRTPTDLFVQARSRTGWCARPAAAPCAI